MSKHTITAKFADGTEATRRTGASYTHASRRSIGSTAGRGPTVRFHTSESAAREAAGRYGEVVRTDFAAPAKADDAPVWRVRFADGETVDVATDEAPFTAAKAARPGKRIIGASRVRS